MTATSHPLTAITLSEDEEKEVTQLYEERADHLELETIKNNTVLSGESDGWLQALTGTGAKLLVGPRGCGKTHLMRFAFTECVKDPLAAFAVYTNLNRYYRLEPLLCRNRRPRLRRSDTRSSDLRTDRKLRQGIRTCRRRLGLRCR